MPNSLAELQDDLGIGILIAIALMVIFWVPYLIKEIRTGKGELGPLRSLRRDGVPSVGPVTPSGAGDNNPGRPGDPAPGQPSGQPDPYDERAQRNAPPVSS
jgi:hypothetical protein